MRLIRTSALLLVLALGGCGGGESSPEEKAADAVGSYVGAVKETDGERACELLTDAGRAAVLGLVAASPKGDPTGLVEGGFDPTEDEVCVKLHDEGLPEVLEVERVQVPASEDADVDGDKAAVGDWTLEEQAGDWKITSAAPLEEAFAPAGVLGP